MKLPAKQVTGVENPATVLLIPAMLGKDVSWWSHDGILLGGLQVVSPDPDSKTPQSRIGYLPRPIPRSWGNIDFGVVVEYEGSDEAKFSFRLYYGCGDPSELRIGQTKPLQGKTGSKQRLRFELLPKFIMRNEMLRCTLEVQRNGAGQVLVYGAWMEVGA